MPAYDTTWFKPPAPVGRVTVRNQESGAISADVPMLLDSGADTTLIPQVIIDKLAVPVIPNRRYELLAFDGTASLAEIVQLDLIFLGRTFRGQFLVIDQEWGVLGRNILNSVPQR